MSYYVGIDLHSDNNYIGIVGQKRYQNINEEVAQ